MERYCIIYSQDLAGSAEELAQNLISRGVTVCAVEAPNDQVSAAKEGINVTPEISACMVAADVCIFFISEKCPASIILAAQGISEKKMIALHAAGMAVPQIFLDLADTKINLDEKKIADLICGPSVWLDENGEEAAPRKLVRIKCQ